MAPEAQSEAIKNFTHLSPENSLFNTKPTQLMYDPEKNTNILPKSQISEFQDIIIPGCAKPYAADSDMVWIKNPEILPMDTFALVESSEFEKPGKQEGLLSFFKHQVGQFDFGTEMWTLITNPDLENNDENNSDTHQTTDFNQSSKNYSFNCLPKYPITMDDETNRLYAISPNRKGITLKTLEPFDTQWVHKNLNETLPIQVSPNIAAFSINYHDQTIYILGGYNSDNNQVLNSVFSFDIYKKQWNVLPSMPRERMYHQSLIVDGEIYVTGGCTLSQQQKQRIKSSKLSCLRAIFNSLDTPLNLARTTLQDKVQVSQGNKPMDYTKWEK